MKKLKISLLPVLDTMDIALIGSEMVKNSKEYNIDVLNWPAAYNYLPKTKFNIARTETNLWIHFRVVEKDVKAVHTEDQDPVWKDSCVEFFVKPPNAEKYLNFEFNCLGACLSTRRKSRTEGVVPLTPEEMQTIKRYASIGSKTVNRKGSTSWQLTVQIPMSLIDTDIMTNYTTLYGNFYKCGDETANPHYVSWSVIKTEQPDFHQPDFFGIMRL